MPPVEIKFARRSGAAVLYLGQKNEFLILSYKKMLVVFRTIFIFAFATDVLRKRKLYEFIDHYS